MSSFAKEKFNWIIWFLENLKCRKQDFNLWNENETSESFIWRCLHLRWVLWVSRLKNRVEDDFLFRKKNKYHPRVIYFKARFLTTSFPRSILTSLTQRHILSLSRQLTRSHFGQLQLPQFSAFRLMELLFSLHSSTDALQNYTLLLFCF